VQGCDAVNETEQLKQLIAARACVMIAKAQVAEEYSTRIAKED
jgi:hypothetical protein